MTHALVEHAVYWVNAFPTPQSIPISPASIVTGRPKPNFNNPTIGFGRYALIHAKTTNNMKGRSVPGIALRASNEWGGFYFMSLLSGKRIHSNNWTELPISEEVIARVYELATHENQPELVDGMPLFEWELGKPIEDDEIFDLSQQSVQQHDEEKSEIENNDMEGITAREPVDQEPDMILNETDDIDELTHENDFFDDEADSDYSITDNVRSMFEEADEQLRIELDEIHDISGEEPIQHESNTNNVNTTYVIGRDETVTTAAEDGVMTVANPPVDTPTIEQNVDDVNTEEEVNVRRSTREGRGEGVTRYIPDIGGKTYFDQRKAHHQLLQRHRLMRTKRHVLLTMLKNKVKRINNVNFFQIAIQSIFLSAQMSARKGIREFGERAVAAMVKEFRQLDQGAFPGKPVVEPIDPSTLTAQEIKEALEAVSLIKEKRSGVVKGRTCANGSKQRKYLKEGESVASPTVSVEALIVTFLIDAFEERAIGSFDIPGAYLHTAMPDDKRIIMVIRDEFVDMMIEANPKYAAFVKIVKGRKVLYLRVLRAIYGCIESAMLWYRLFSSTLEDMGFVINPYDKCVANKEINGSQCTIVWYLDDAKVSHAQESVVREVIAEIEKHFGKMNPTYGREHEYLGMKIGVTKDKKVTIDMKDQIREIIDSFCEDISGTATTPAAKHLMLVNDDAKALCKYRQEVFHSTTAKLLYLKKRARPDIETAVAFLTTRVSQPTEDDWKKLRQVLQYLHHTINIVRTIGCKDMNQLQTWVDAAFAVHPNMRSHTGGVMSMGKGIIHSKSAKQKLNTKSSTEAEIVGVSEYVPYTIWLTNFMKSQGYEFNNNNLYQDNQSAIRMETNGRNSCTGNSRHIDIRYFFVKDRVDKGELNIKYCPTHMMLADYFTKPLQGSLFRKFRDVIMGIDDISSLTSDVSLVNNEFVQIKERVENTSKSNFSKNEVISPNSSKIPSRHRKVKFKDDAHTYASLSNVENKPMTKSEADNTQTV